jgi:hypothetical protein
MKPIQTAAYENNCTSRYVQTASAQLHVMSLSHRAHLILLILPESNKSQAGKMNG